MQAVRGELAPWEAKIADAQSRHDLAASERDLLVAKQTDAKQRLQVLLEILAATICCTHNAHSAFGPKHPPKHQMRDLQCLCC